MFELFLAGDRQEVRGGDGGDGEDDVEAALAVLQPPPEVVRDLPTELRQIQLHPTEALVLACCFPVMDLNGQFVGAFSPGQAQGFLPDWTETFLNDLGLRFLPPDGEFTVGINPRVISVR